MSFGSNIDARASISAAAGACPCICSIDRMNVAATALYDPQYRVSSLNSWLRRSICVYSVPLTRVRYLDTGICGCRLRYAAAWVIASGRNESSFSNSSPNLGSWIARGIKLPK